MAKMDFKDRILYKKGKKLEIKITLIGFRDGDDFVLYSPSFDLYAYGTDEETALNSFRETIILYIDYVKNEDTLVKDLIKRGWKKNQLANTKYTAPDYNPFDIMSKKGVESFNVKRIVEYA